MSDRVTAVAALDASWQARWDAQMTSLARSIERRDREIAGLKAALAGRSAAVARLIAQLRESRVRCSHGHLTHAPTRGAHGYFVKEGAV